MGRPTVKVVPFPGWDFTSMVPPWDWIMPWVTQRPRPVPSSLDLVVKKGSKISLWVSSFIPIPLSFTSKYKCEPRWRVVN